MLPLLLLCAGTGAAAAAPRHNVLFILADDYGWADSGWHRQDAIGRQEVRTPTMDGLIAEGIELDRHYTYKFCSPTRSSLQVLATRPGPGAATASLRPRFDSNEVTETRRSPAATLFTSTCKISTP